jgi:hypothetical protein
MTRTSVPGNDGGFVLLDALICLFTAALILLLISGVLLTTLKSSAKTFSNGISIIEERNRSVEWREAHE